MLPRQAFNAHKPFFQPTIFRCCIDFPSGLEIDLGWWTILCSRSIFIFARSSGLPRKEVIQPHLPIRLPCYDFTPVICLTLDGWLLAVTSPALGAPNSHGVTGGVYKARERIHRSVADLRLLATPTSCGRVAAHNPN